MQRIQTDAIQDFEVKHIEAVRKLAPECTVLLKNDGILPLACAGKIALYGSGARRTIKGGTGSGDVNVRHFVTVEEGMKNAGFEITTGEWIDAYEELMVRARKAWVAEIGRTARQSGMNPMLAAMGQVMPEPEYSFPLNGEGDTAVYVLSRISGEGNDRKPVAGDVDLTETEIRDILALNEQYDKFVLVLNVGGMVNLKPVENVKCILLLGQLGTPTGDVLADLLLGKSYPSGKLTMTWAPIEDYPSTEGFGEIDDTSYKEGVYVGYRYFDTAKKAPTYPFGYGLGYTTFDVIPASLETDSETVTVTVRVKNTGSRPGMEVIQVYVTAPCAKLDKPYQELKAFAKTSELQPGEEQKVALSFATASMASFSERHSGYVLEAGAYVVRVGSCSDHTRIAGTLLLCEDILTEATKHICPGVDFRDYVSECCEEEECDCCEDGGDCSDCENNCDSSCCEDHCRDCRTEEIPETVKRIVLDSSKIARKTNKYSEIPAQIPAGETISWTEVESGKKTIDEFIVGLTPEQLMKLCIGNFEEHPVGEEAIIGQACTTVAGGAGETTGHLADLALPSLSMCDGPAGLRLNTAYKIVNGKLKAQGSALAGMMEFLDEEDLKKMAAMFPKPTAEELEAPLYYQYCIAIPIGTALAQSFNTALCEKLGDLIGIEMEQFGCTLWLAPALNIHRSPLCGRNFEYYSEDPLVSGKIAAAITRGVQKHKGCGTTIKHYACNNQETNRYGSNSKVSERALREIYLKGFEIAVKESAPKALMTSYNLINGEHSCNSKDLNTYVLRDEWGFEGLVMTDWLVTRSMMKNENGRYGQASAAGCVKAGNHVTMPGGLEDLEDMKAAFENDGHAYPLSLAELQTAAKTVLETVLGCSQ